MNVLFWIKIWRCTFCVLPCKFADHLYLKSSTVVLNKYYHNTLDNLSLYNSSHIFPPFPVPTYHSSRGELISATTSNQLSNLLHVTPAHYLMDLTYMKGHVMSELGWLCIMLSCSCDHKVFIHSRHSQARVDICPNSFPGWNLQASCS